MRPAQQLAPHDRRQVDCPDCVGALDALEAAVSRYRWVEAEQRWGVLWQGLARVSGSARSGLGQTLWQNRLQLLREAIFGQDAVAFLCFARGLRAQLSQMPRCVHRGI